MQNSSDPLRNHLVRILDWGEAHVGFDKAIEGIQEQDRGARVAGFEHSIWQLLEHMRLAQKDLLDFCLNAAYVHTMKWPDDYWPREAAPANDSVWDSSVSAFRSDRDQLKQLALNDEVDLFT